MASVSYFFFQKLEKRVIEDTSIGKIYINERTKDDNITLRRMIFKTPLQFDKRSQGVRKHC